MLAVTAEDPARYAPLVASERAVEIRGRLIAMALPQAGDLDGEDLENAALWIAGGTRAPRIEEDRGRPVLSPGDFSEAPRLLAVEVPRERIVARLLDDAGQKIQSRIFALQAKNRLSVQG